MGTAAARPAGSFSEPARQAERVKLYSAQPNNNLSPSKMRLYSRDALHGHSGARQ